MSALLDNAIDSLREGVGNVVGGKLETADKWAILQLFHAIELLLKERLRVIDSRLIYRKPDEPVHHDSVTVGMKEAFTRLAEYKVSLPEQYRTMLLDLQKRRNRIEHHRYDADASNRVLLGEALKFISYFLEEQLGYDLRDVLSPPLYREAKELIFDYDELVRRADKTLNDVLHGRDLKDQLLMEVADCPDCGNEAVLIGDGEPTCYFCEREVEVAYCNYCSTYQSPEEIVGVSICGDCFDHMVEKD